MTIEKDHATIIAECKKKGEKWTDISFPTMNASICPGSDWKDEFKDLEWKRADKLPSCTDDETKAVLFKQERKTPADIQMGPYFKNQALINAISNLNSMIRTVFVNSQPNDQGVYCLQFLCCG